MIRRLAAATAILIVGTIGLGAVAILGLPAALGWGRTGVATLAGVLLGRDIAIEGRLALTWLPTPTLEVAGLRIANTAWGRQPALLTVEKLMVSWSPRPLLNGDLVLPAVAVTGPVLALEADADGHGNWPALPPARVEPRLHLGGVRITGGRVSWQAATDAAPTVFTLNTATAASAGPGGPLTASVGGRLGAVPLGIDLDAGSLSGLMLGTPVPVTALIMTGSPSAIKSTPPETDTASAQPTTDQPAPSPGRRTNLENRPRPESPGPLAGFQPLTIAAGGVLGSNRLDLDRLTVTTGDSIVGGRLLVDLTTAPPYVAGVFSSRVIHLDDWLPAPGQASTDAAVSTPPAGVEPASGQSSGVEPAPGLSSGVDPAPGPSSGGELASSGGQPAPPTLFPNLPLRFDWLPLLSADVTLDIDRLFMGAVAVDRAAVRARVDDGVLTIGPLLGRLGEGWLSARIRVDGRPPGPPQFQLQLDVTDLMPALLVGSLGGAGSGAGTTTGAGAGSADRQDADSGVLDGTGTGRRKSPPPITGAAIDATFEYRGQGAALRPLLAGLSGDGLIVVGPGTIGHGGLDLIGVDLLVELIRRINAPERRTDQTDLHCAVLRLPVIGGVLTIPEDSAGLETGRMVVRLSGTVDLSRETLDLAVRPQPYTGLSFSIGSVAELVRLQGTFLAPRLGADKAGFGHMTATVGAALVTEGASLWAQSWFEQALALTRDTPCAAALASRAGSARGGAPPSPSGIRGTLDTLYDRLFR